MSLTSEPDFGAVASGSATQVVLWPATPAGQSVAQAVELRRFEPTLEHPAGSAGPLTTPVANWNAIGASPVFSHVGNAGDSRILFEAFDHAGDGSGGTFLTAPVGAVSQEVPYTKFGDERSGDLDALDTNDAVLWADSSRGELATYRSTGDRPARAAELQNALGGCCAYHPTLGVQQDGKPWVLWYSNATGSTGLYMAPLDPATGAAAGATVKVPGSETVANNFARLPLVCRNNCQVFYGTQASLAGPTKLASWVPGDAEPVKIDGAGDLTLNGVIAAAPTADGGTWLAWYDRPSGSRGGYRVRLGDARGLGGKPVALPGPSGTTAAGQLFAVAWRPDQLLLGGVATSGGSTGGAVWLDMVTPKGDPAVPNKGGYPKAKVLRAGNAIAVVSGRAIRRNGVKLGVQSPRAGTKATVVACATRAGHPPSPCKRRAVSFKEPGFKTVHIPPGPPVRGQRGVKLTLRSGGKSKSVTLKLRR